MKYDYLETYISKYAKLGVPYELLNKVKDTFFNRVNNTSYDLDDFYTAEFEAATRAVDNAAMKSTRLTN